MAQVQRILGDGPVTAFGKGEVLNLKANLMGRGLSINRQVSILLVLKRFLVYATEQLGLAVLPPDTVAIPRRPRREVGYLTAEEVERFIASIKMHTGEGHTYLPGLRFRALVEVLLGSAMRISEVLSIDRAQVDFKNAEAKIIGKGSKERVVFFTERALQWVGQYLAVRTDEHPALFATTD